jgi:hypothetical protein
MLKIISHKLAMDISPNKVPGFINATAPEMILSKIRNQVENEVFENGSERDGWSPAGETVVALNELLNEYGPEYSDYIINYFASILEFSLEQGQDENGQRLNDDEWIESFQAFGLMQYPAIAKLFKNHP